MRNKITVLVAECKKDVVRVETIENNLHEFQKLVGGYIEPVYFAELTDHNIVILANEEGLLEGLRVNDNLLPFFLVGWLVFVGYDGDDFTGLTPEQIDFIYSWLGGLNK